jgi:hypothetical protein
MVIVQSDLDQRGHFRHFLKFDRPFAVFTFQLII